MSTNLVGGQARRSLPWPYTENGKTTKIWASGTVKLIADGLTDKRSARGTQILVSGARRGAGCAK